MDNIKINNNIVIRKETPGDYRKCELITKRAFWNLHSPGAHEHLLVRMLRGCEEYLPELSRVAEIDGEVVGAIYYTKSTIEDGGSVHEVVTFGPLVVEPTQFGRGIGSTLLVETLKLAKSAGYPGVVICGEPNYYPRFGFKTCDGFGISDADGNNYPALMCLPLVESFLGIHGRFHESPVYEASEADEEALRKINEEFPGFPEFKVRDGFYEIYDKHIGCVESVSGGEYTVKYWELSLKAALSPDINAQPQAGDHVLFKWKSGGSAEIVEVLGRSE